MYIKDSVANNQELKELLKEENVQKIAMRFVHQSECFYKLALGQEVSVETYTREVLRLFQKPSYYNFEIAFAECVPCEGDLLK